MTKIKTISAGASESVSQWPGFLKSCYQCTFSSFYVTTNKYFYVTTKIFFCRLKIFLGHYKFVMSPQVPCDQSFFMPPQHFYVTTKDIFMSPQFLFAITFSSHHDFLCHKNIFMSPQKYLHVTTKICRMKTQDILSVGRQPWNIRTSHNKGICFLSSKWFFLPNFLHLVIFYSLHNGICNNRSFIHILLISLYLQYCTRMFRNCYIFFSPLSSHYRQRNIWRVDKQSEQCGHFRQGFSVKVERYVFALFLGLKHNQGLVDMGKNIVGGVSNVSRESVEPVRLFCFWNV